MKSRPNEVSKQTPQRTQTIMNQNGHYTTLASKPIFMRKGEKTNHINKKKTDSWSIIYRN
jgi:hypothetical protein